MYSLGSIEQGLFKMNGKIYTKLLKVIALRRRLTALLTGWREAVPFSLIMLIRSSLKQRF